MSKKCKKCGRTVFSTCSRCSDSDIVDDLLYIGLGIGMGMAIDSLLDHSDSSSSSSDYSSPSVDFGGGDFGGAGSGGEY